MITQLFIILAEILRTIGSSAINTTSKVIRLSLQAFSLIFSSKPADPLTIIATGVVITIIVYLLLNSLSGAVKTLFILFLIILVFMLISAII